MEVPLVDVGSVEVSTGVKFNCRNTELSYFVSYEQLNKVTEFFQTFDKSSIVEVDVTLIHGGFGKLMRALHGERCELNDDLKVAVDMYRLSEQFGLPKLKLESQEIMLNSNNSEAVYPLLDLAVTYDDDVLKTAAVSHLKTCLKNVYKSGEFRTILNNHPLFMARLLTEMSVEEKRKIVIIGGIRTCRRTEWKRSKVVYILDPLSSERMTPLNQIMLSQTRMQHSAGEYRGITVICGGLVGESKKASKSVELLVEKPDNKFDIVAGPDMLKNRTLACGATAGDCFYIFGGKSRSSEILCSAERFSFEKKKWDFIKDVPISQFGCCSVADGKIVYVFPGYTKKLQERASQDRAEYEETLVDSSSDIEINSKSDSQSNDSWHGIGLSSTSSEQSSSDEEDEDELDAELLNRVFRFDTELNDWFELKPLPKGWSCFNGRCVLVKSQKTIIISGCTKKSNLDGESSFASNKCLQYDIKKNEWQKIPSTTRQRSAHGMVEKNGTVYAFGGWPSVYDDSLEMLVPGWKKWKGGNGEVYPHLSFFATVVF